MKNLGPRERVVSGELERELSGISMPEIAAEQSAAGDACLAAASEAEIAGVFRSTAAAISTTSQLVAFGSRPGVLYAGGAFSGVEYSFTGGSVDTWRSLTPGRTIRYSGRGSLYLRSISGETSGRLSIEHYAAPREVLGQPELFDAWARAVVGGLGPVTPLPPAIGTTVDTELPAAVNVTTNQLTPITAPYVGGIVVGRRFAAGDVVPVQVDGTLGNINLRVSDWTPAATSVGDAVNTGSTGAKLSYTVPSGYRARLRFASWLPTAAPTVQLQFLAGGVVTITLLQVAGATFDTGMLVWGVAGDIFQWNVTAAVAGSADACLVVEELIDT